MIKETKESMRLIARARQPEAPIQVKFRAWNGSTHEKYGTQLFGELTKGSVTPKPFISGIRLINLQAGYIVCELPPTRKLLCFDPREDDDEANVMRKAFVTLPWQVFIAQLTAHGRLGRVSTFWRRERLRGMDSPLGDALVYNRDSSGTMCMYVEEDTNFTPAENLANMIEVFYGSTFNSDYSPDISGFQAYYQEAARLYGASHPEAFQVDIQRMMSYEGFPTQDLDIGTVTKTYWPPKCDYEKNYSTPNADGLDAHGEFTFGKYQPLSSVLVNLGLTVENETADHEVYARLRRRITQNSTLAPRS